MSKLKLCPFCGGTVIDIATVAEHELMDEDHNDYEWCSTHFDAVCDAQNGGCGVSTGKNNETPEEAAEAWNRRVGDTR